jgi:hypothetical protein
MSMQEELKSEFIAVIEETRLRLKDNNEWRERYAGYATSIRANEPLIKRVRRSFREWSPLYVYLNISSAKKAINSVSFELRYMGQTVAELKGNEDGRHKLSTRYKDCERTNRSHFDCSICLSAANWRGKDVKKFRKYFKNRKAGVNKGNNEHRGNEEHRLQSLLLTEFSKTKSEEKPLLRIQPVTIAKVRFPMPTQISASNHKKPHYIKPGKSGGIDILARTGTGGKATHLCIMELKDKNERREPPKDAMKQAVAYATFIRELLRSDCGGDWWKLFGFVGGKVPEPLVLYAACVMPSNCNNDYSFRDMKLNIESDTIKLHYLYFKEENNKIRIEPGDTSLGVIEYK